MPKRPPNGLWMTKGQFETLWRLGHTQSAIADANYAVKGWRPDQSMVSRHAQDLGLPSRRLSHGDLIPWAVAKRHQKTRVYRALLAISRERQGVTPSKQDRYLAQWLTELLTTVKTTPLVVDYDPARGFMFMLAEAGDTGITRKPANGNDDGSPSSPLAVQSPPPLPPLSLSS